MTLTLRSCLDCHEQQTLRILLRTAHLALQPSSQAPHKTVSTLTVALGLLAGTDANTEHVERRLVLGGSTVPSGSKTYTVGIRQTPEGNTFCGGSLISPDYVLTTALCTTFGFDLNYVSVGTHFLNGTHDGEQIKVASVQNHTDFNITTVDYDFALVKLERPSKFKPVKLASAGGSNIIPGEWATVMGWGEISNADNSPFSYELQGVKLQLWANEKCLAIGMPIAPCSVCAGGAPGKDSCTGNHGDPLILEKKAGDADDVLVGVSSWGYDCGKYPSVYSRVSYAIKWINSVIKSSPLQK